LIPFEINQVQPRAWDILARFFENDRVAGAYLFHGSEGRGQIYLALSLAALLNCEKPRSIEGVAGRVLPCGECSACRTIYDLNFEGLLVAVPIPSHKNESEAVDLTNEYLDRLRQDLFPVPSAAKHTSLPIAAARSMKHRLSMKSQGGVIRVAIFYQMERMLPASADALLKLIEEPPPNTVIILTAQRPDLLLPTIQSRTQPIRLDRVPAALIEQHLCRQYEVAPKTAALVARVCDGSIGGAVDLARGDSDQAASSRAVGFLMFKSLLVDDGPNLLSQLAELVNPRDHSEVEHLMKLWQSLIGDCAGYAINGEEADVVNIDFIAEIERLSEPFQRPLLAAEMLDQIKITLADLRRNVHIQGALMALALRLKACLKVAG
jgi:DNA polymerase-3 subunit delta'